MLAGFPLRLVAELPRKGGSSCSYEGPPKNPADERVQRDSEPILIYIKASGLPLRTPLSPFLSPAGFFRARALPAQALNLSPAPPPRQQSYTMPLACSHCGVHLPTPPGPDNMRYLGQWMCSKECAHAAVIVLPAGGGTAVARGMQRSVDCSELTASTCALWKT